MKKIRKKAPKESGTRIVGTDHPDIYGIPMQMYAHELFCRECEAGVMRPSQSRLAAPTSTNPTDPNAPPMVIHVCSNPDCSHSETIPFPPFPRPASLPAVDVTDPNILAAIAALRQRQREVDERIAVSAQPTEGGETDGSE